MDEKILLVAGYCGLACKACSVYIASCEGGEALKRRAAKAGMTAEEMYCKGCRFDKTSPYCTKCDIKKCIKICESLEFAKNHTVTEWEHKMQEEFTCGKCGTYNSVYAKKCNRCGNETVNEFAKRHWEIIKDSPERENV